MIAQSCIDHDVLPFLTRAAARHLALSLSERLERSWQLYLEGRSAAALDRRDDDPSPFYEKARALGLYRP